MKKKNKILCTICARIGSKGVKNKNFKLINGKPLILYTVEQAIKSKIFDVIIISTDNSKIKEIININNKSILFRKRPKHLADDKSSKIDVIKDALSFAEESLKYEFNTIMDLDVTCPLRNLVDIKKSLNKFVNKKSNVLFSVCESNKNPYFNIVEKKKNSIQLVINSRKIFKSRQKAPKTFDINGAVYLFKRSVLKKLKTQYGNKTDIYVMPQDRSIDIDTNNDWKMVNYFLKNADII